jgi:glycosyltransferase involved in cell wall biosynthesis
MYIFSIYVTYMSFFRGIEFEIVVIDDNSPDGTQEVVAELQRAFGSDRCVDALLLFMDADFLQ